MGEKTLRSQTKFVNSYAELIELISDQTQTVDSILPLNEDMLQVKVTPIQETDDSSPTTSIAHAAMTTSHGRMVLYDALDVVQERALYHDTGKITN